MNSKNSNTSMNRDLRDYFTNCMENVLYVKDFSNLHKALKSNGYEIKPINLNDQANEKKEKIIIIDFASSNLENEIEIKSWSLTKIVNEKRGKKNELPK